VGEYAFEYFDGEKDAWQLLEGKLHSVESKSVCFLGGDGPIFKNSLPACPSTQLLSIFLKRRCKS
jgi:hypothetical protein